MADELRSLGLDVIQDDTAPVSGGECGNLLARIEGSGSGPGVLLCAHLDTVPLADEVEPVLVDDGWENERDAILGADNKAAVAVMLVAAQRFAREPPPVGVELLFTVSEENALAGAKAFDVSQLRSAFGYVYDHASPIGEVVMASPTYYRLEATFHGAAAHAGIRPEDGRSAITAAARAISSLSLGRLDDETTANVGTIEGGSGGTNVVPERCSFLAEARSLSDKRVEEVVARDGREHPRGLQRVGLRRRRRRGRRAPVPGLSRAVQLAGRGGRRVGVARVRVRAAADRHRRRLGRQRARGVGLSLRQPRRTARSATTSRPSA